MLFAAIALIVVGVDAGFAVPLLMLRARLHAWAIRRIGFAEGERVTPLDAARGHLGATVVLAALHPSWVGAWLWPMLALPGDHARSAMTQQTATLLTAPRGGVALCSVLTDEAAARGLPPVEQRVDLRRGGWFRTR